MGTPRASGSLDQMRRIQISASGGGECAVHCALETTCDAVAISTDKATAPVGDTVAMFCWSELDFVSGWTGGPVRSCDVAQQALFAQHPGSHAFSLGVFVTMHGAAGNRTVAAKSASPTAADTIALRNITLTHSTIRTAGRGERPSEPTGLEPTILRHTDSAAHLNHCGREASSPASDSSPLPPKS